MTSANRTDLALDLQSRFGELRSAAHTLTGDARWSALCAWLEDWPHEHLAQVVIPYLEDLLRDDDSERKAPEGWCELGDAKLLLHPAFALARACRPLGLTLKRLAVFLSSPSFQHITKLDLSNNKLGARGAKALAHAPHLKSLTALDLFYNDLRDAGVKALASSPKLKDLTALDLSHNTIGDEGAKALARSPHLTRLTTLSLSLNHLGPQGAYALASCAHLNTLTTLNLIGNTIGAQGAKALAQSPHLRHLTTLHLNGNKIGAQGAQALASSPYLPEPIRAQWRR